MPLRGGESVGGYEVIRLLGRGACGEVFQVRSSTSAPSGRGDVYAMKVIPCDTGSDKSAARARESALAEARLLQGLRHPHIVNCSAVFFDESLKVVRIVLEYMDGGDLQGVLAARREAGGHLPSAHFSRRTLAAVGSALAHVHGAGILHRDVKPANILLSRRSRRIKLSDFGIAKLVEATTLRANTLVGTPYYFSPELVSGDEYGVPSDCWALGACLYEVASLHRPFEAANQLALIRKICEESPPNLPDETVEDVRAVIEGFLCKRPRERMSLATALRASVAIAALAVSEDDMEWADDGDWESYLPESPGASHADIAPPTIATELPTEGGFEGDDSWRGAHLVQDGTTLGRSGLPSSGGAVAGPILRARHILSAEVDDPEDLQHGLLSLEKYRQGPITPEEDSICSSLVEEFRTRLGALREEAAALLEGLLLKTEPLETTTLAVGFPEEGGQEGGDPDAVRRALVAAGGEAAKAAAAPDHHHHHLLPDRGNPASPPPPPLLPLPQSSPSPPRAPSLGLSSKPPLESDALEVLTSRSLAEAVGAGGGGGGGGGGEVIPDVSLESTYASPRSAATSDAEDALEVATSLGLDTGAAEEHLASIRKMLSVRVVWGDETRFCLLPMRATFGAVLQQVSRRFGLRDGTILQMCWIEAGDRFSLASQRDWEELLQRRGLAGGQSRVELEITNAPLRRRRRLALAPSSTTAAPQSTDQFNEVSTNHRDLLRVAGTQAPAALRAAAAATAAAVTSTRNSVVGGGGQPPLPTHPPAPQPLACMTASPLYPSASPHFASASVGAAPLTSATAGNPAAITSVNTTARRRWQANPNSITAAEAAAKGKAWAVSTGREQPVRWSPSPALVAAGPGIGESSNQNSGRLGGPPPLDLCLQGVAARRM